MLREKVLFEKKVSPVGSSFQDVVCTGVVASLWGTEETTLSELL